MGFSTCAYTSGDVNSPYTCTASTDSCTAAGGQWGCANAFTTPWLSCVDAGGFSIDSFLSCSGDMPFCEAQLLYIAPGEVGFSNFGCAAQATTVYFLSTATNGPSAGSTASASSAPSTFQFDTSATSAAGAATITPVLTSSFPTSAVGTANGTPAAPTTSSSSSPSDGTSLGTSGIIGIVVGIIGAIAGIATIWMCLDRVRRNRGAQRIAPQPASQYSMEPLRYGNQAYGPQNIGNTHNHVTVHGDYHGTWR